MQWYKAILSLILTVVLVIGYPAQALAQNQNKNPFQIALERIQSLFVPQTEIGAPVGRVRGGAGRGRCPVTTLPNGQLGTTEFALTALVPTISNPLNTVDEVAELMSSQIVWGKTIEAYPSFWFYIPYVYQESELERAKFVILDEDRHIVAGPILFQLPKADAQVKPHIVKITLPKDRKPLAINKQYNWYFSIICDEWKPSRNPGVAGWIQRVSLPILAPKNYRYYAEQGIWYDTVTRLAESRMTTLQAQAETVPSSIEKRITSLQTQIQEDWIALLRSLKLDEKLTDEMANSPIVELNPVSEAELQPVS